MAELRYRANFSPLMMDTTIYCIIFIFVVIGRTKGQSGPVISTTHGKVQGRLVKQISGDTTVFFGIPYARAPTGELRFMAPESPEPWIDTRPALQPGPSCYQSKQSLKQLYASSEVNKLIFDEDCLNLNVFIPGVSDIDNKDPLAVLIWFAGRTLDTAAPNLEPPHVLAARGNIVVVTVNYRVGVFGYYSTGDDVIPGNMAFLDQQMALKWVQDNIAKFAGDKKRVSIAGEGLGAQTVSLHVLSSTSSGLFSRAISLGATMAHKYLPRPHNVTSLSAAFAKTLLCDRNDSAEIVKCLQTKTAERIDSVHAQFPILVDGTFLTDDPYDIWNSSISNPVDYIIGCSSHKAGLHKMEHQSTQNSPGVPHSDVKRLIESVIESEGYPSASTHHGQFITQAVEDQYLPDYLDLRSNLIGYVALKVDALCMAPAARMAAFLREENKKTYLYEYDHLASIQSSGGQTTLSPGLYVLGHQDIVNPDDIALSADVITMMSTFIRSGTPTWVDTNVSPPSVIQWPVYDPAGDMSYTLLDSGFNTDNFRSRPNPEGLSFWNVLLPGLSGQTRLPPFAQTVVVQGEESMIFNRNTLVYVLIALSVLCVVFLLSMIGAFFLVYDARRQLQKLQGDDENKYNEAY